MILENQLFKIIRNTDTVKDKKREVEKVKTSTSKERREGERTGENIKL